MTLVKARLLPKDTGIPPIEFMFNPTELVFDKSVTLSTNEGSRTQKEGQPKVGFGTTTPYTVTITKILFDTYETGEDVVKTYLAPFKKAIQLDDKLVSEKKERPPLYTFIWGGGEPLLKICFVEKLTYKLTLFLPDGTPVRAVIDSLTLKEADEKMANTPLKIITVDEDIRQKDSLQNRRNGRSTSTSARKSNLQPTRQGRTRR